MGNRLTWPSNPYKWEHAQDTQEERIEKGLFRCNRCDCLKPLPAIRQDGYDLCRRCIDVQSPLEAQTSMAEERAQNAVAEETLPLPVVGAFNGVSLVTAMTPTTLNLTRGGASKTIAITGVNLSSSNTWSSSSATHITVTPTVNSTTSVTLTISADGTTTRADYNITFGGDTLTPRGILKVR